METFLEFLPTLGLIISGAAALYLNHSRVAQKKLKEIQEVIAKISAEAAAFIANAEAEYKDWTGAEKFEEVVNQLYVIIPDPLKVIITRQMVREIVQSTFDEIKKYMTAKLDKTIDNIEIK